MKQPLVSRQAVRRHGAVVMLVIVCLAIAAVLQVALVEYAVSTDRRVRQQVVRRQCWFLAESGLSRARSRLAAAADYSGETWQIPADQFEGGQAAEVRIEVGRVDGSPESRRVTVTAEYPVGTPRRSREQITTLVQLPAPGETP